MAKGWQVMLPSEAEWEKAARGGLEIPKEAQGLPITALVETPRRGVSTAEDMVMIENTAAQRRYPWGDNEDPNRANYDKTQIGTTSAVGCFGEGRSPYGCEELSGNVWEWARSLFRDYEYDPRDGREDLTASDQASRVLRGGAFFSLEFGMRCAGRSWGDPLDRLDLLGFRVVVAPYSGL